MKAAFIKALVVLIPSYTVAFLTDKMVYVVPTLAAAGFFAAQLDLASKSRTQVEDDDADDTDHDTHHDFDGLDAD